jgi:hypothetical protein
MMNGASQQKINRSAAAGFIKIFSKLMRLYELYLPLVLIVYFHFLNRKWYETFIVAVNLFCLYKPVCTG